MRKALLIVSVAVFGLSFGCGNPSVSTFTDKRDGKVYRIVKIDRKVWFAENLNYAAEGSECYENSPDSCAKYGRLYTWDAALKACPAGTHLFTDKEWTALEDYVGFSPTTGKKLKSTSGWNKNGNGTDEFGFSALPGGFGFGDGSFRYAGLNCFWWSATEGDTNGARGRYMGYDDEHVYEYGDGNVGLFSVRCVQDD